jgi:hypothetical protein
MFTILPHKLRRNRSYLPQIPHLRMSLHMRSLFLGPSGWLPKADIRAHPKAHQFIPCPAHAQMSQAAVQEPLLSIRSFHPRELQLPPSSPSQALNSTSFPILPLQTNSPARSDIRTFSQLPLSFTNRLSRYYSRLRRCYQGQCQCRCLKQSFVLALVLILALVPILAPPAVDPGGTAEIALALAVLGRGGIMGITHTLDQDGIAGITQAPGGRIHHHVVIHVHPLALHVLSLLWTLMPSPLDPLLSLPTGNLLQ